MSGVEPDTYRVGPGNILQFQPLKANSPHCTETHVPSPCSQKAVTGPTFILKNPLQCTKPHLFSLLYKRQGLDSVPSSNAAPTDTSTSLRALPKNLRYVANVTIFTKHFRSNKIQRPLLT